MTTFICPTRKGPGRLLLLVLFALSSAPLYAQKGVAEKTDRIINQAMTQEKFPGMSVAIIENGKVIFQKSYGVRSLTKKDPVNENTIFSIGSVSKAFTGVAIMQLVQEGRIGLDEPIKKYMKNIPAAWGAITIRQYMTHTSGIPNVKGEKDKTSFEATMKGAGKQPMAFTPPGKKQQYNNFNFAMLGKLIEAVTGMTYIDYMTNRIFKPFGMNRTGVNADARNVAMGHLLKNGQMKELETHFEASDYGVPSGGLQTSLTDFIAFGQALSNNAILKPATINTMFTPYSKKCSNTPGWHSRMAGNELVIHKGGGGTGIGSVCDFAIVPSRKLVVIVMSNKANNSLGPADIVDDILYKGYNISKGAAGDKAGEGNER